MYIYSLACNKDKPYKNVSEPRIKRKSQSHLIFVQFLKQTLTISGILSERLFDCRTPRYSREFPGITKVHFFVWECLENFSGISRENVFVFNWPHIAQELPRILGNFLSTHFQALRASENSRELSGTGHCLQQIQRIHRNCREFSRFFQIPRIPEFRFVRVIRKTPSFILKVKLHLLT